MQMQKTFFNDLYYYTGETYEIMKLFIDNKHMLIISEYVSVLIYLWCLELATKHEKFKV